QLMSTGGPPSCTGPPVWQPEANAPHETAHVVGEPATKVEKCETCADRWVASTTVVTSWVYAVGPAGAVKMDSEEAVLPAGTLAGSNAMVTVTGTRNCWPSGPNVIGVPTGIAVGGAGASGVELTLIMVSPGSAPGGIDTPSPSELVTEPPVAPTVMLTGGG